MKTLINHTELALNIKNNNLENADTLYKNKITVLLSINSNNKDLKKLLYSINHFIYTYLCISTSLTLEDVWHKNIDGIESCNSKDDLINLGKKIIKSYIKSNCTSKSTPENEIIKHALSYIHSNIEKKITLEKVATHIHISSNYLCYLFKEITGFKFCEYINIHRIDVAKEFLNNSVNTLDIISFKCGFNSQSHFSTTFKKYVGVSPNKYKKLR